MKRKLSDVLPPDSAKGQKVVPFTQDKIERPADNGPVGQLFRFRLRNGLVAQLPVPNAEGNRLFRAVQSPDDFHYVAIFDSFKQRIALNLREITAAQFEHFPSDAGIPLGLWIEDPETVNVFFKDSAQPLALVIDADAMTIAEFDEGREREEDLCQLDSMLFYLQMAHDGSDDVVHLMDADGAQIWLRINEIALVAVPLELLPRPATKPKRKAAKKK